MRQNKPKNKTNPGLMIVLLLLITILIGLIAVILRDTLTTGQHTGLGNIIQNLPTNSQPDSSSPSNSTTDPTPIPREDIITGIEHYNPLTGVPMDLGLAQCRPLAVALNNIQQALPMNGVSQADIIHEFPVEGGLTRMLALYQDPSGVKLIGSIRSARHYTVQLAESYDAILVAAGRSPLAQKEVTSLGIPFLNEVEGPLRDVFYRDRNRISGKRVSSLHSVVTTGERLMQWLPQYNFRLEHEESYKHTLHFVEDGTPEGGFEANEVVVRFSSGKTTTFNYDRGDNAYYMRQYNMDYIDANNNTRPAFTNILILKTSVTPLRGDDSGRLDIITTGSGEGYFVNGGKHIDITWSRSDTSSPFIYTRTNGTNLDLGVGKTYICIIPGNMDATFE